MENSFQTQIYMPCKGWYIKGLGFERRSGPLPYET